MDKWRDSGIWKDYTAFFGGSFRYTKDFLLCSPEFIHASWSKFCLAGPNSTSEGRTVIYIMAMNFKKKRLFEDIHCISFSSHGITGYITTQKLYKYASPINVNQSHIRKYKKVDSKCLPHFIHTTVRKRWNLKCWRWFYSYDKVLFQSEDRHLSN